MLDLSWGIAGPMTTMFLVDNGAHVTRIEPPDGDPFAGQPGYRVWNRGKRSARLDLQSDDGRAAFHALAADTDVVVESFSPGTAKRLGADHDTLATANPRLVTCSITGYGHHPQHRDRPGFDALVAARTGLLYDQKGRSGTPMEFIGGRAGPHAEFGRPEGLVRGADRPGPVFPRTPWPSIGATYLASLGIAAALRARAVTGHGQHVETSLLQGALASVCLNWQRVENPDAPLYWMWPVDGRSIEGLYECADGRWVHHWTVRPSWVLSSADSDDLTPATLDGAYRDDPDRVSMEPDGLLTGTFLHPLLEEAFKKFPSDAWVRARRGGADGRGAGAFAGGGARRRIVPRRRVRGTRSRIPRSGRSATSVRCWSSRPPPGAVQGPAPRSGAHTEEILAEAAAATPARAGPPLRPGPRWSTRWPACGCSTSGSESPDPSPAGCSPISGPT